MFRIFAGAADKSCVGMKQIWGAGRKVLITNLKCLETTLIRWVKWRYSRALLRCHLPVIFVQHSTGDAVRLRLLLEEKSRRRLRTFKQRTTLSDIRDN